MNTRKRKHSTPVICQPTVSKRAKLLSQLWPSQENSGLIDDSPCASSASSGIVYRIKAIVGETENEYLIDWEDDSITGESFKQDWQPKSNVNTTAVDVWKAKEAYRETTSGGKRPNTRQYRRKPSTVNPSCSARRGTVNRPRTVSNSISSPSSISAEKTTHTQPPPSVRPSLETTNIPDLIVRVSQHTSLDRDLYIAYESSLSTQGTNNSISQNSSSHLRICSRSSQLLSQQPGDTGDVVPDSQSLLGSSSYVPTATTTDSGSRSSGDPSADTIALGSSCRTLPQDSTQRSVDLVVPASQDSGRNGRRSRSAPASTIPNSTGSSSSGRSPPSFPRSASDPGPSIQSLEGSQDKSLVQVPGSSQGLSNTSDITDSYVIEIADRSQSDHIFPKPAIPASQNTSTKSSSSQRDRRSSSILPDTFAIAEDYPQDHPSQATTTDDSVLSERDSNSQLQGRSVISPEKPQLSPRQSQEVQDSQTPPIPPFTLGSWGSAQSPPRVGDIMTDSSMAARELFEDSRKGSDTSVLSAKEKLRARKALTDATLAQQRAERQRPSTASPKTPLGPRSPSYHVSKTQTPSRSKSPSVLAKSTQRLPEIVQLQSPRVTGSGALLPVTIGSPLRQSREPAASILPLNQNPLQQARSPERTYSRTSKSPSVIPDRLPYQVQDEPSRLEAEPLEIDTQREVPLPVRSNQSVPHTPITPSKLSLHKEVSLSPNEHTLNICNLKKREHAVSLSMPPRIQQQYCTTIRFYARTIKKFMEESPCKRETVEGINLLLDEVSKVTTHIDLQGSGPSSQEDVSLKHEAEYAESCSEKFVFLGCLLKQAISDGNISLIIVARPGPLQDILETYLRAKEVSYTRSTANSEAKLAEGQGRLHVTLLASGDYAAAEHTDLIDLIIAFDETFQENAFCFKTRRQQWLPPIIRLVVYASLEHLDLCLPRTLNPIERLRRLVFPLLQTQKRVGALDFDESRIPSYASEVFKYIKKPLVDGGDSWPLPRVRPIEDISFMESDSDLSDARSDISDDYKPAGPLRYWPNPVLPKVRPNVERNGKRAFDLDWGDSLETQAKKQKMAQHYNAGHIEVVPEQTQENLKKWLEKAKQRITAIEAELERKTVLANDLQRWAGIRQHDYEKLRKEHGDLRVNFTENTKTMTDSLLQIDALKAQILALNTSYKDLQKESSSLQAKIQNMTDPAVAAAAYQSVQLQKLETENTALKKRITSLTADFEFTRQQYQQASAAAVESSAEIQSLKPELDSLRHRNESSIAEYRKIRDQDINKEIRKEVQRLKQTVKQRDAFIHKLEGENVELKRGRAGVQTRGSSVQPRSPRGAGSRGVSPAAGMLGPQGQGMGMGMGMGHAMVRGGSGRGSRLNS